MTYTRVRVTFLHFFAIFIQMGGWNGKNGGKKGIYYIYTMYIYAEWRRFALSYGYPMVRVVLWQVKPSILYRYYAAFAF